MLSFFFAYLGVEKNNDNVRQKSNKSDAPKDILFVTKRLQITGQHERVQRTYKKCNTEYWSTEIGESRRKRKKQSAATSVEIPESNSESVLNIENFSAAEIKEKLRELGVQNVHLKS